MQQQFDVAGYHLRGLVRGLDALGLNSAALLREVQLDRSVLDDLEVRFPEAQVLALWLLAEQRHAAPAFGLTLAMHVPLGSLELVDYVIGASSNVATGMRCLEHQAKLCASGFLFHVDESARSVRLDHRHGIELAPPSLIEYLWALVIGRFRNVCGPEFRPKLTLRSGMLGPADVYRGALGQVPERGSLDAIEIDARQWAMVNPRHDPMLSRLLNAHASDVMQRIPEPGFAEVVLATIAEGLRLGDPTIEAVAVRLRLSARTLQRRVSESFGRTYQELVEHMRRDLAKRYLRETQLSLTEISSLLAYSEPSAFGRAFQRWTGTTPASYRRHASAEASVVRPGA